MQHSSRVTFTKLNLNKNIKVVQLHLQRYDEIFTRMYLIDHSGSVWNIKTHWSSIININVLIVFDLSLLFIILFIYCFLLIIIDLFMYINLL